MPQDLFKSRALAHKHFLPLLFRPLTSSSSLQIDYEAVARLCGCTPTAARFRFYKLRDTFQELDSLKDETGVKDGPREKIPRTTSSTKTTPNKKGGLNKEALEALESLEDLPSERNFKFEDREDMYSDVDVKVEDIDGLFDGIDA